MAKRDRPEAPTPDDHGVVDDAALFRAAIGDVRELPGAPLPPARPRPRPRARMAEQDEAQAREDFRLGRGEAFVLDRGDALSHRRDQVPPRTLKRLSQGLYAAQDELDLHHSDAATAEALLRRFLAEARDAGFGCVRVVHGKGLNSSDSLPVLKNVVDRILRQRADVLAFHSAPAAQGGTGAVLVLLARR
ncbi:Smr/MutS family protein [Luteimonas sp. MC1572]|uniref:Smr/MutS family protein n=1 Tax=Luteimonas sp. MC1572 TaxID=2799325 RepID=UPI0018F07040|nr:Smr/MutS family protein [Luteimonas sp. MC1572]MBJ6982727.1 Smr/MutS family protein [Luteimonas sp. MC1572]QQO03968.1 Smr/MutS family protein [Luteimonas sp. MC1572]